MLKKILCISLVGIITATPVVSQSLNEELDREEVTAYLSTTLEYTLDHRDSLVDNWKARYTGNSASTQLLAYSPPNFVVSMARIASFLCEQTGDQEYARTTRDILISMKDYRQYFPERFRKRAEYRDGVPVVHWFRSLPVYINSFNATRNSGVYSESDLNTIRESVASSVDYIFHFPEWGAMNRAMLRAESFMAAALAFPDHPDADKWKKMGKILADDNIGKWEIEDAQIYHAVWMRACMSYIDMTGQQELFHNPMMRYYFDYSVKLLAPYGDIAEFGDGRWRGNPHEYYVLFERGAKEYQSREMKWAANHIFDWIGELEGIDKTAGNPLAGKEPDLGFATLLIERDEYMDPEITARMPAGGSGDVLEDVIGKKIVFRDGWDENAGFMLYNYKDEGYYSILQKDYLKQTLAVEEEKMHHGHSDEQSICLFMKDGTVLLNDGNYRPRPPSGDYGAWRADIFHNRVVVRNQEKAENQRYFDVLRNSGAYNTEVRTAKLDFQSFGDVEYARTRLEDRKYHYRWDRTLLRHRAEDYYIVVDALKFQKSDYYTLAGLYHTQEIIDQGENWFVTRIDTMFEKFLNDDALDLLVIFPQGKDIGTQSEYRDYHDAKAVFTGMSQYYDAGKVESFVTVLYPLPRGDDPGKVVELFDLVKDDMKGVGLQVNHGDMQRLYGVKLDLDYGLLNRDVRPRYTFESGKITYGDVTTDADFFHLKTGAQQPHYAATNFVRFVYRDSVLFDAPKSNFFQVWGKSDHVGQSKWRRWSNY